MDYNRSLGIKLELIADFARAASQAAEQLDKIKQSFGALKEAGNFDVKGLTSLNEKLTGVKTTAESVNTTLKNVVGNLGAVDAGAKTASAAFSDVAKQMTGVKDAASSAATATKQFEQATAAAKIPVVELDEKVANLRRKMVDAAYAAADFNRETGKFSVVDLGPMITGMEKTTEVTTQAYRAVNALEAALARLPFEKVINVRLVQNALPGMVPGSQAALPWGSNNGTIIAQGGYTQNMLPGAYLGQRALPWGSSDGSVVPQGGRGQYALPGGYVGQAALPWGSNNGSVIPQGGGFEGSPMGPYNTGQAWAPYGQIALNPGVPQPGDSDFIGPTAPWYQNTGWSRAAYGQWRAQQQYSNADMGGYGDPIRTGTSSAYQYGGSSGDGTGGGGTPPISMGGQGGSGGGGNGPDWSSVGNSIAHEGSNLFWGGFSGVMVGSMILKPIQSIIDHATEIDDMLHMSYEAMAHAGMNESNQVKFGKDFMQMTAQTGGDFQGDIAEIYPFISTLPTQAGINMNDPKSQAQLQEVLKQITQLHVVDTATGAPDTSPYDMVLDVAATAKNLNFDMNNINQTAQAYDKTISILTQLKNKTGSTAAEAAQAFKQVGVVAGNMGVDTNELVGLVGILADNKILGGVAGNQIKRILSRQAMDPAAVAKLQAMIKDKTDGKYNLSMFDDQGHQKGAFDLIAQVANFEKKYLDPKDMAARGKIDGTLAGLYAGPAFGNLVKFAAQAKGSGKGGMVTDQDIHKFLEDYTKNLIHAMPEGYRPGQEHYKPGMTPNQATADIRARADGGNVKIQEQKLDNQFKTTMQSTFEAMKPDIIAVLNALTGLVKAFDGLPAPVRKSTVEFVAIAGAAALFLGAASMIVGAGLKLVGNFIEVGAAAGQLTIKAGPVVKFFQAAWPAAINVGRIALMGLMAVDPIVWIVGIVAAIVGFAVAWKNNWGDVQGKTHAVISWIQGAFSAFIGWFVNEWKALPGQIGYAVGAIVAKTIQFANDAPKNFKYGLDAIGNFMNNTIPKFVIWAGDMIVGFVKGLANNVVKIYEWFKDNLNPAKVAGDLLASGQAMASTFMSGFYKGVDANTPKLKSSLQKVRDHLPSSDAKTGPLSDLSKSGQAGADVWIDNLILGMGHAGPKLKKALKTHVKQPIDDVMVSLKGDSVSQVEAMTQAIEDTLSKHGAVIKKKWLDLIDPGTGEITRFKADLAAVKMAINQGDPLEGARDVSSKYISDARTDGEAANPMAENAILNQLKSFSAQTTDEHIKSEIDKMANDVIRATDVAVHKMSAAAAAGAQYWAEAWKQFNTPLTQEQTKSGEESQKLANDQNAVSQTMQTYQQRLQNAIDTQKKETASVSELVRQLALEEDYRTRLQGEIRTEIEDRNKLYTTYINQKNALASMVAWTPQEEAALLAAKTRNDELGQSIENVDVQIETNQANLTKLNGVIDQYTQKVKEAQQATNGWAQTLSGALTKGLKDAGDAMGKQFGNLADNFISKLLGNSATNSPAGDFVKGFFGDIIQKIFTGDLSSIFHNSKIPSPPVNMGGIAGDSPVTNGTVNGVPATSIIPTTGSTTDLGQQIADGITAMGDISASASTSSSPMYSGALLGASSSGIVGIDSGGAFGASPGTDFGVDSQSYIEGAPNSTTSSGGYQNVTGLGRFGMGIGGALNLAEGYSEGGLGGAVQSTLGAYSLLQAIAPSFGPWGIAVAGAVGLGSLLIHHDNPADMPDKYNTQQYGQGVANLTGAQAGANGQTFYPDQSILQQTNNQGEIAYIEEQLAAGKPANMTQAQYNQLVSEFGESSTGSGVLNFGHDIGEQWITGAAGASTTPTNYLQLDSDAQSAMQAFAIAAQAMLQAQQNADNLAASFTTLMLNGPSGFVIPGAMVGNAGASGMTKSGIPAVGGVSTQPGTGTTTKPTPAPTLPNPLPNPVHVHIFEGANVNGDASAIKQAVMECIPELTNAVNQQNYTNMRIRSGYSSVTTS